MVKITKIQRPELIAYLKTKSLRISKKMMATLDLVEKEEKRAQKRL